MPIKNWLTLGVPAVVVFMSLIAMTRQDVSDKKQDYEIVTIQKHGAEFNEEFAVEKMIHADSKEEREFFEKKADQYGAEVAAIEFKREAAEEKARVAALKAEQELAEMGQDLAEMGQDLENSTEEEFDKEFDF